MSYHRTRLHRGHAVALAASRSCPFRCTFCYHAGMGAYRRHSIVGTVDGVQKLLEQFRPKHVAIYDEPFSANRKRIYEFCDLIEERGLEFEWFCQLRVDHVDVELLRRMRQAGCVQISYGFESGSDTILESMQKKIVAQVQSDRVGRQRTNCDVAGRSARCLDARWRQAAESGIRRSEVGEPTAQGARRLRARGWRSAIAT